MLEDDLPRSSIRHKEDSFNLDPKLKAHSPLQDNISPPPVPYMKIFVIQINGRIKKYSVIIVRMRLLNIG